MPKPIRIALIADIHLGPDEMTKKGSAALPLVDSFVKFCAQERPDLVIDLGDRLTEDSPEADARNLEALAGRFAQIEAPRLHVVGNHDFGAHTLSIDDGARILGADLSHHVLVMGDWRIIVWNADTSLSLETGFPYPADDVAWLEQVLPQDDRPTLLFGHVPLGGESLIGNAYLEQRFRHVAHYPDDHRIRDVLERHGQVIAAFSGHSHWNALHTVDGLHHVTIPSLTETFVTHPDPAGAFAMLEAGNQLQVEVYGRDPRAYRLPLRRSGRHWIHPDKPGYPGFRTA